MLKIAFIHNLIHNVETREMKACPRIGDQVAIYMAPAPTVTQVVWVDKYFYQTGLDIPHVDVVIYSRPIIGLLIL